MRDMDHANKDSAASHFVFHTGYNESLLFPSLYISTPGQLVAACLVVMLVALMYEGLRLFVSWLQVYINTQPHKSHSRVWFLGAVHTTSYILHLFVGYCLMLLFMTLNIWLCLSLLLGAGVGFVLFHFRPVKSCVFRFLCCERDRREDCDEIINSSRVEVISDSATTMGYEHIQGYALTEGGRAK